MNRRNRERLENVAGFGVLFVIVAVLILWSNWHQRRQRDQMIETDRVVNITPCAFVAPNDPPVWSGYVVYRWWWFMWSAPYRTRQITWGSA